MRFGMLRIGGRAMKRNKVYAAFIMSVGIALTLVSNQAFGQFLGAARGGASTHSPFHPSVHRSHLHRDGRNVGAFFPGSGGFFWGPSNGPLEVAPPISAPIAGDFNYTYKFDVPWDWAHRYPPSFFASPPEPLPPRITFAPSGCPAQSVTVPGADGKDQTVTMIRC